MDNLIIEANNNQRITKHSSFPWASLVAFLLYPSGKESTCQCRRCTLIPGSERFPREGNGNPPQYPCLGNPMDRGA